MPLNKISVIILNYNSEDDLKQCTQQIIDQVSVCLSIIIVDNHSRPSCVESIKKWLAISYPNAVLGSNHSVNQWAIKSRDKTSNPGQIYFIENTINNGYSSGNNIGIRLAETLKSDSVLIVNPDMQITDDQYISKLSNVLFSNDEYKIAASKILGLDGKDQNPLRESTFWEEILWPFILLKKIFSNISYTVSIVSCKPTIVSKVSGCCMMIKMDFLKKIHYLDENVFLYCEEPILSAQVKSNKGTIIYDPRISAIHAHKKNEKENSSKRMQLFIKSRKYYLKKYSAYNNGQLFLLSISYSLLSIYYHVKYQITKVKLFK